MSALFAGPALSQVHVVKRQAKTQVIMSAAKDPEGNVFASITLASAKPTCLNGGRVYAVRQFNGVGVPSEADFGYGLLSGDTPSEGKASYTKSGYFDGVLFEQSDFELTPISTAGVSPWVWQGSWPADLRVVVQGPGGASTATVSAASYVRLEMSLYLHRKVYRRGDTKEILICPGKTVSRWLPL